MKFILTGIAQTHKLYDSIVNECEVKLDDTSSYSSPSDNRDCILRRFLLEKRDREAKNDELAANLSYKQLNYLLADVFGASLDTTLSTLRWYLLLVASNHDVQQQIYDELEGHVAKGQLLLLDDIEHLPLLKASIAESQRLKSVVPCGIPHGNATGSATLGGFFIPKDTMVSKSG